MWNDLGSFTLAKRFTICRRRLQKCLEMNLNHVSFLYACPLHLRAISDHSHVDYIIVDYIIDTPLCTYACHTATIPLTESTLNISYLNTLNICQLSIRLQEYNSKGSYSQLQTFTISLEWMGAHELELCQIIQHLLYIKSMPHERIVWFHTIQAGLCVKHGIQYIIHARPMQEELTTLPWQCTDV